MRDCIAKVRGQNQTTSGPDPDMATGQFSPASVMASVCGTLLVGAASPGAFTAGTTASVVEAVSVEQMWSALGQDSSNHCFATPDESLELL